MQHFWKLAGVVLVIVILAVGCRPVPSKGCTEKTCSGGHCSDGVCVLDMEDAGNAPVDAGSDGVDAGQFFDAGVDAGQEDASIDAGEIDAGFDAGEVDAGEIDAGDEPDAGHPDSGAHLCRVMTTFPVADDFSVYARSDDGGIEHALGYLMTATTPLDSLEVDVYWAFSGHATGVVIPAVRDLAVEANYSTCTACVVIREECPNLDSCARAYLARSGTISLDEITRDYVGEFKVSLTNVRFDSWLLGPDMPSDGGCIILNATSIDISR